MSCSRPSSRSGIGAASVGPDVDGTPNATIVPRPNYGVNVIRENKLRCLMMRGLKGEKVFASGTKRPESIVRADLFLVDDDSTACT